MLSWPGRAVASRMLHAPDAVTRDTRNRIRERTHETHTRWHTRKKKRCLKKKETSRRIETFTGRSLDRPFDRTVPRCTKGTARGQSTGCIDFLRCVRFFLLPLFLFLSVSPLCFFVLSDRKCITVRHGTNVDRVEQTPLPLFEGTCVASGPDVIHRTFASALRISTKMYAMREKERRGTETYRCPLP